MRKNLAVVLCVTLAPFGCVQPVDTRYDPVPRCLWAENDKWHTFPECTEVNTSAFMGTIDGIPYSTRDDSGMNTTATSPLIAPQYELSLALTFPGSLDVDWWDPYIRGQWTQISLGGIMRLPEDGINKHRHVFQDSQILVACEDYAFLYILHIDGGDLTGCSRSADPDFPGP